jgi:DNA polymerase elongation subunit (family B)
MINVPLNKILFLDIETVGCEASFDALKTNKPELAFQFENYYDWFEKRFPEDGADGFDSMFHNRSALVSEFLKIACVSLAFVNDDGSIKMQSFSGKDELDILKKTQKVLQKVGSLNYFLCGHNVKGFDIPVLAKRMMINGLMPPKI